MTKHEAAIVSAYTGYLIGDFVLMHEYIESLLGRPVYSHELADKELMQKVREKAKADFCAITISPTELS